MEEDRSYTLEPVSDTVEWTGFSPRIALRYFARDDLIGMVEFFRQSDFYGA